MARLHSFKIVTDGEFGHATHFEMDGKRLEGVVSFSVGRVTVDDPMPVARIEMYVAEIEAQGLADMVAVSDAPEAA